MRPSTGLHGPHDPVDGGAEQRCGHAPVRPRGVADPFGARRASGRGRKAAEAAAAQPETPTVSSTKPYFSLTTNKTYSPNESARLWASYQNVDYLDFRVYHIKAPSKFFKQLDDPHQMGEKEKEAAAQGWVTMLGSGSFLLRFTAVYCGLLRFTPVYSGLVWLLAC